MGGLGGDDGVVKVGCGDSMEEEDIRQGKDMVIIVGASVVVRAAGQGIGVIGGSWFVEEADVVVAEG